jgi:hypothetical protein
MVIFDAILYEKVTW